MADGLSIKPNWSRSAGDEMRALAQFQSDESSHARDNAILSAQPDSNRSRTGDPRIGCAGIVRRGREVLLGRRSKDPNRGLWVLPGGGVGFGETLVETLQRELAEEAGIEVDIENIFDVSELITPPNEHRVIVYMNARYRSGQLVASSDLSEVRFFQMEEIKRMSVSKMISPFVETILRKAALL